MGVTRTNSNYNEYKRFTLEEAADLVSDMNEQEMLFAPGIRLKVICKHFFGKVVECIVC